MGPKYPFPNFFSKMETSSFLKIIKISSWNLSYQNFAYISESNHKMKIQMYYDPSQ